VSDIVNAVLLAGEHAPLPFAAFNVATGDYITVADIAELALEVLGLRDTVFHFTGGDRGWKGDVPVVRINTDRIRALGWANEMSSQQALDASMRSMLIDARSGRLT
jgi:UDP-glucose 4-epimerase